VRCGTAGGRKCSQEIFRTGEADGINICTLESARQQTAHRPVILDAKTVTSLSGYARE